MDVSLAIADRRTRGIGVPTLRLVARRLQQLIHEDAERSSEIADLVLTDAALTLAVLFEANQAVAPTGVGIASVQVALQVVGRDALGDIVTRHLLEDELGDDRDALELYRHSLVTSLVCESLARVVGSVDSEGARIAGLVHDVGAWSAGGRHDAEGLHAKSGARLLRRLGLPEDLCRAVGGHHGPPSEQANDRAIDLTGILTMADRVATALCVASSDPTHSANVEDGVLPRLRVLARLATERAAREVSDTLLVLGTLLGVPSFTLDGMIDQIAATSTGDAAMAPLPPAGLPPRIRKGLDLVRDAANEAEVLTRLMRVVRSVPGVRSALLILEEAGESMLEGHPDNRPFFLRRRDLAKVAENFDAFIRRAHQEGAALRPREPEHDAVFALLKAEKLLLVPLSVARTPVGIVVLADSGATLTHATASALGFVARVAGDVLEAQQLSRGSYLISEKIATDDLTGVLNRGHFFERLAAEVRASNRYRRTISLAMIDIDHFKSWNDKYGHQVGDRLLADVSKTIRDCAREADMVGRYGGDEFIVGLPGCGAEQAMTFAERVRDRVHSLGSVLRESCYELTLSVSVGVASVTSWPADADVLLFRADHALYRAKEKGRNRVCVDPT